MTLAERACVVAFLAAAGVLCPLSIARAQSAEAEVLFRDGRNLIKRGNLAAGCDKLAASERLESSIGTLLNLGDCREKLDKLASAWAAFRKAEAMAKRAGGDDKRQAEAGRRADKLEPRLSNLSIEVPARVDGMIVRRDGEIVDPAMWSTALPVDPGSYTISAEAPGYVAWTTTVTVKLGSKRQVVAVPGLERARTPDPAAAPPPALAPAPADVQSAPVEQAATTPGYVTTRRSGTWSVLRRLSVGVGIAGAGALGTGIYFGWHAKNLQDRADRRCPLTVCADTEGLRLNDQARTSAKRANILYIAGGGALASAVVLWLIGAPQETVVVTPIAGAHHAGLSLKGRF